jgi:PAS domain S-box-containing protein
MIKNILRLYYRPRFSPFWISGIYLIVGLCWIYFSDEFIFADLTNQTKDDIKTLAEWKGYAFVLVSSILMLLSFFFPVKKLLAAKKDFEELFEKNPQAMWIYDTETLRFVNINQAAIVELGYTKNEFFNMSIADIRHENEKESLESELLKRHETEDGFVDSGDYLLRKKNGEFFYANISSFVTIYKQKKCGIVKAQNVQMLSELRVAQANMLNAINNSALVTITDIDGYIIDVNQKFTEISGYEAHELIGKKHTEMNSGYHDNAFWDILWTTIKEGKTWRGDVKNRRKDGSFFWTAATVTPLRDSRQNIKGYMAVRHDITERKFLEETLKEKNKLLTEIAWAQSHLVRSPVANILGLCNLFDKDIKASLEEKEEYLILIKKSAEELDDIIRQITNLAYHEEKSDVQPPDFF